MAYSRLTSVFKKLYFGPGPSTNVDDDDDDDSSSSGFDDSQDNEQEIEPKNGFFTGRFDESKEPSSSSTDKNDVDKKGEDNPEDFIKSTGMITAFDETLPKGVIDRMYQFEIQKFCSGRHLFTVGCQVDYEAQFHSTKGWEVKSMKLHVSKKQLEDMKDPIRRKTLTAHVIRIEEDFIVVQWGNKDKTQHIPKSREILPPYKLMMGDWLKVNVEECVDLEEPDMYSELGCGDPTGKILSVEPTQKKTIVGKVTRNFGEYCIDDHISYDLNVVKGNVNINRGDFVICEAVESTQGVFNWRAVVIGRTNLMQHIEDPQNRDEDGNFEQDVVHPTEMRIRELYMDRYGLKIQPSKYVRFQPLKIGDTASKSLTISNTSSTPFVLHKISFNRDQAVCRFELNLPNKEKEVVVTLGAGDSYKLQISCTPLMIGRTRELLIFDFSDFKIARDLIVTGLSDDEEVVQGIAHQEDFNGQHLYKRSRGVADVEKVMVDHKRTCVKGQQLVRAPFFSLVRLPLYRVPDEIWRAFREKNEGIVRKYCAGAVQPLGFWNYQDKFRVSLWFEEVENDLRRSELNLSQTRLQKRGDVYVFIAPGIQDFHPPVLIGDPINVFDEEDPKQVKYQGYIKKIVVWEVHAQFGEAFNYIYTGAPMTIQFCAGRMTYKRQHYAVEQANQLLGESFLFPSIDVAMKEPRIPFYEDDKDSEGDVVPTTDDHSSQVIEEPSPSIGLFNRPPAKKAAPAKTKNSAENGDSRRAKSLRAPSTSTVKTTEFTGEVKLKWFNKGLNEEQKDAVRRILRGQGRPLPYIIYGPPGTGKTVTVVEAIMQVHKLDPNSRILVVAPTNHAADVISDHLANSKQYHPGDFVRLNGFMRSEQVMMESIKDFCEDGEALNNIAMNRLIVSTCATAGQFFNLKLTPGHFTHVFVDEAGYCTEPETMIAAVNLAIRKDGQLILAGDPKQLGPVLMSDVAQNLDLNISFLERLMSTKTAIPNVYTRDIEKFGEINYGYNPLVLTKLVKNYRAHQLLLQVPSKLFYDNDLVSCAPFEEAYDLTNDAMIANKVLQSPGIPLVFHGVQGTSSREKDSPSWYNAAEVIQVVDYIRKLKNCGLKNDDIGIITPYRKQAEKLRIALQFGCLQDEYPKVGSVEEFQGGERKVVIISTVRSLYEDKVDSCINRLTFIYNPKRFNVAITRAKALMIIVGNPHVLCKDNGWMKMLEYCVELNAYTGCNLPVELDVFAKNLVKSMDESARLNTVPTVPVDKRTGDYNPDGSEDEDF